MKQFILGVLIGASLMASLGVAGMYDKSGAPSAPRGSVQQFDYFRERQQQLDVQALRRQADQDRAAGRVPCGK